MKRILKKLLAVAAVALFGLTVQADDTVLGTIKDLPVGESANLLVNIKADKLCVDPSGAAFTDVSVAQNFDRTWTVTVKALNDSASTASYIKLFTGADDPTDPEAVSCGRIAVTALAPNLVMYKSISKFIDAYVGSVSAWSVNVPYDKATFKLWDFPEYIKVELAASKRDSRRTILKVTANAVQQQSQHITADEKDNPGFKIMKSGDTCGRFRVHTWGKKTAKRLAVGQTYDTVLSTADGNSHDWYSVANSLVAKTELFSDKDYQNTVRASRDSVSKVYARVRAVAPGTEEIKLAYWKDVSLSIALEYVDLSVYQPVQKTEQINLAAGPEANLIALGVPTDGNWRVTSDDESVATADAVVPQETPFGTKAALKVTANKVGATKLYATNGDYEFTIDLTVSYDVVTVVPPVTNNVTTTVLYMGEELKAPYEVVSNTPVQFVYTADEGYAFADGSLVRTTTVCRAATNPTTDPNVWGASKLPSVTTTELKGSDKKPYDCAWQFTLEGAADETAFGDWDAEFFISTDRDIETNTVTFASWQKIETEEEGLTSQWVPGELPDLKAGEEIGYFERFLGKTFTYSELCEEYAEGGFRCAVRNHSTAYKSVKVKVVLRLTKVVNGEKRCIYVPLCPFAAFIHFIHKAAFAPCCHPCAVACRTTGCKTYQTLDLTAVEMTLSAPTITLAWHDMTHADSVQLFDFNKDENDEEGAYWEPTLDNWTGLKLYPTNCTERKVYGLTTQVEATRNGRKGNVSIDRGDSTNGLHIAGETEHLYDYGFATAKRPTILVTQSIDIPAFSNTDDEWTVYPADSDMADVSYTKTDANNITITVTGKQEGWAKIIAYNTNKVFCASCKRCGPCQKKRCHFCKGCKPTKVCKPFLLHPPCVLPFFRCWTPCHICAPCTLCKPCNICKVGPCVHFPCSHHGKCEHGLWHSPVCGASSEPVLCVKSTACGSSAKTYCEPTPVKTTCGKDSWQAPCTSHSCSCRTKHVCGYGCWPSCQHVCTPCYKYTSCICAVKHVCGFDCKHGCKHFCSPCKPCPTPCPEPEPEPEPEEECTCYVAGAYYELWVKIDVLTFNTVEYIEYYGENDDRNVEVSPVPCYVWGVGRTLDTPETRPDCMVRPGLVFAGWYTNETFLGEVFTATTPDDWGNKRFWSKWIPAENMAQVVPSADENITLVSVTTNGQIVAGPPYYVNKDAEVTITYAAKPGLRFDDETTNLVSTFIASASPTTDPVNPVVKKAPSVTATTLTGADINENIRNNEEYQFTEMRKYTFNDEDTTPYANWKMNWYLTADRDLQSGDLELAFEDKSGATSITSSWFDCKVGEEMPLSSDTEYQRIVNDYNPYAIGVATNGAGLAGATVTVTCRLYNPDNTDQTIVLDTWTYTFSAGALSAEATSEEKDVEATVTEKDKNEYEVKFPGGCPDKGASLWLHGCCPGMKFHVPAKVRVIHGLHKLACVSLVNHLGHVINSKCLKGFQPDGTFSTELTAEAQATTVTKLGKANVDGKMNLSFETKEGLVYKVVGSASLSTLVSAPEFCSDEQEGTGAEMSVDVSAGSSGKQQFFYQIKVSK